jgi:mxaK protein
MRRRTVHVTFGVAVAVCASIASYQMFRLHEAQRVNDAIVDATRAAEAAGAPAASSATEAAGATEAANGARTAAVTNAAGVSGALATSSIPEAQFAQAVALAKRGDYEGALKHYKALSRGNRPDLATDALYNAGNLQLREALKDGRNAAVRMLPLIELAKQSYRGALRQDPGRWDARYNLDRALWLAPELDESLSISVQRDAESRVMSTLQSTRADLP